ncbi:MAG: hypothetical protein EBX70_05985, partial [Betaproteobacteria bacterium]|nr:hypothetical protein [Betaproteobacteria bacterium]
FISENMAKRSGRADWMQRYARGTLEQLHLIDCRPWNKVCAAGYSVAPTGTKTIDRGFLQFHRFLDIRFEVYQMHFEEVFGRFEERDKGYRVYPMRRYSEDSLSQISLNNATWADTKADWSTAFHGTRVEGLFSTLIHGGLKRGPREKNQKSGVFCYKPDLEHKACSPKGAMWERALAYWQGLKSDEHAGFDHHEVLDLAALGPQITWGTSPEHCIAIDGRIPDPADERDPLRAQAMQDALAYMGLRAGDAIAGTAIDRVFIGSCTNGRLSDLRVAAEAIGSGRVADRVQAWVVPGSFEVARQAQAEGLDRRFKQAGFQWREPGCSLCVGANGEQLRPKERSVSTTNRNFVGRQGPGARTHLANPITAAKSAIAGVIAA